MIIQGKQVNDSDQREAFKKFARRVAKGEITVHPRLLNDEQRRLHIRSTLREDHTIRIKNKPEEASDKFDKLSSCIFKFFRGSSLLYYRDQAGSDSEMPVVFTIGDVHPENFGIMPNENNVPFFGVNDFDEAYFAPFTYDVKRGAVGFYLAAKVHGFKKKQRCKIVREFIRGYMEGLVSFAKDDRERWHQFRLDNSPPLICELIESAKESRRKFLDKNINFDKERFITTDKIVPYSKHLKEFQEVVYTYAKENDIKTNREVEEFFKLKDVALKKNSGTASLGLDRFWLLVNGPTDRKDDNIILEMKQARDSSLAGLTGQTKRGRKKSNKAENIVKAHNVHLAGGDRFYGYATFDDKSYLIRERSPFKKEMDLDSLGKKEFRNYAWICGETLAQTHARSDESDDNNYEAEEEILKSINPDLFEDDILRFAQMEYHQVKKDYKLFKQDHELGAFDFRR